MRKLRAFGLGMVPAGLLLAVSMAAIADTLHSDQQSAAPGALVPNPNIFRTAKLAAAELCHEAPTPTGVTDSINPGETLFISGSNFGPTTKLRTRQLVTDTWAHGEVLWADAAGLLAVLPVSMPAGAIEVSVGTDGCWSSPILINAPAIWWRWPRRPVAGGHLRLFGQNLTGGASARIVIEPIGSGRRRELKRLESTPYSLLVQLPHGLTPGNYRISVDTGIDSWTGGEIPHVMEIASRKSITNEAEVFDAESLLQTLKTFSLEGGRIFLRAGTYKLNAALRIPERIELVGAGWDKTILKFEGRILPTPGLVNSSKSIEEAIVAPALLPGMLGPSAVAAVLMFGSESGLANLRIDGSGVIEQGIVVAGTPEKPVENIRISNVLVNGLSDFNPTYGRTEAVLARHVRSLLVEGCDLRGNGPALYLEDVRESKISDNTLSGGGEGVISGREGGLSQTIIENNQILSIANGGPQAVRAIWLSTLAGSSYENFVSRNFGNGFRAPPGTEQNRGEAILFETALTHPFIGNPDNAGHREITLPRDGPRWDLLGPESGTRRTRLEDYFVTIVSGLGSGQTRRILGRAGRTLVLDKPWALKPDRWSVIVIGELFFRNVVVRNKIQEAMSGIQFWINGVENVIAGNYLENISREGVAVFGAAAGGPQSVKPYWPIGKSNISGFNRGVGVSHWNAITGNTIKNAGIGISLASGDFRTTAGPVEWPLTLGNSVRRNRIDHPRIGGIRTVTPWQTTPLTDAPGFSLIGTIIENNSISGGDDRVAVAERSSGIVIRNNRFQSKGQGGCVRDGELLTTPPLRKDWIQKENIFLGADSCD